jgi:hypothetical protein
MPKPKAPWFVRFVVHTKDEDSGRRTGIFQAASELRDSAKMTSDEWRRLQNIREWFNDKLEKPTRLSLSARPNRKAQAISWFKESATEHITQIRAMISILEAHDITIEAVRTQRPGYIVYEDEHQVAAYPFADTPT